MPNSYKLTVKNKTGAPQHYSFFSAIPVVSGGMSGDIWSNVLKACPSTPNDGKAMLEVWDNYYAVCGSYDGVPNQGMRVSVSKSTPVSLGYKNSGNVVMGSSLALKVIDKRACDFGPPTNPGAGKIGNFQITTAGDEFTFQDATDSKILDS